MLKLLEKWISRIVDGVGKLLAVLMLLMVLNVAYDVLMRYVFRASSVGMQEMEWHLFSVIILFVFFVALQHEGHVRVDFLYDRMARRKRAMINIIGTIVMLVPVALLILFGSFEYVQDSYMSGEISEDPGGLHYRWVIKSMIPLSFAFLLLSAVGYILQNIEKYRRAK